MSGNRCRRPLASAEPDDGTVTVEMLAGNVTQAARLTCDACVGVETIYQPTDVGRRRGRSPRPAK
ncbi:hypothetical protein [Plantactinospora sp. GCM10030261]|uniref:hypothetical protein n=1 Tax=Plantactinospora sp. GCM10030261 TaxID=3273420 RepID=UPI003612161E